jgi:hypothetical protein
MARNERKDKWQIIAAMAARPDLTAREAEYEFNVNRHTVGKWCKEAGISLGGHKHPRVSFILALKKRRRKRLTSELAVLEREIRALEQLDPGAAYIKPEGKK